MTNAQIHEAAVLARFGGLPFMVPGLPVEVFVFRAVGETEAIDVVLEWWREDAIRHREEWRYLNPDILHPDPLGTIEGWTSDEDGNDVPIMLSVQPLQVAMGAISRRLEYWMARGDA